MKQSKLTNPTYLLAELGIRRSYKFNPIFILTLQCIRNQESNPLNKGSQKSHLIINPSLKPEGRILPVTQTIEVAVFLPNSVPSKALLSSPRPRSTAINTARNTSIARTNRRSVNIVRLVSLMFALPVVPLLKIGIWLSIFDASQAARKAP